MEEIDDMGMPEDHAGSGKVELDRGWQNAIQAFQDEGFGPGDIIPHEWFRAKFRLQDPMTCDTPHEARSVELKYLGEISRFQDALGEDLDLVLRSVRTIGYQVVPPQEQTKFAMGEAAKDMQRAFQRARHRLTCIRLDALTDEQRRENADAQGRLAALKQSFKRRALPK